MSSFKEEVRGSNPLRATDPRRCSVFYAVRISVRPLPSCGSRFPAGRFPFVASRNAVSGDGPRRRSSNGRLLVYRSTIRPGDISGSLSGASDCAGLGHVSGRDA